MIQASLVNVRMCEKVDKMELTHFHCTDIPSLVLGSWTPLRTALGKHHFS